MIKFFRHIRQRLVSENKFSKYLIYAIGEIILVVIGILIALQINNWNQAQKTQQFEITILENIQEDILADKIDLAFNLEYHQEMFRNEQLLMDFFIQDQSQALDSINYANALGIDLLTVCHKASFNNLQNNDIGLISNNILYKKITRFHDFYSASLTLLENSHDYANSYHEKFPFFKKHFEVIDKKSTVGSDDENSGESWKQNFQRYNFDIKDSTLLRADEEFKLVLAESLFVNSVKLDFYNQILDKIKQLNALIEDELQMLRK